jgi:hypothetical protein
MTRIAIVCVAALVAAANLPVQAGDKSWTQLFNGKDLSGWDTWLGKPYKGTEVVGLNKDPKGVYSVVTVDGQPAIRISGEIWGALTTRDEYENYHLKLDFKWGEKRWLPRDNTVRDSGLLYHCVGPHGAGGGFWMRSLECQIQEKDCGDFHSVAGVIVDVEAERKGDKGPLVYKKGAKLLTNVKQRIIKDPDNERPTGEWNTIEALVVGDTAVHIVNGKANMVLRNARHQAQGQEVPLLRGKIQLQSESAEVFYRNIALRPLTKIPDEYLK